VSDFWIYLAGAGAQGCMAAPKPRLCLQDGPRFETACFQPVFFPRKKFLFFCFGGTLKTHTATSVHHSCPPRPHPCPRVPPLPRHRMGDTHCPPPPRRPPLPVQRFHRRHPFFPGIRQGGVKPPTAACFSHNVDRWSFNHSSMLNLFCPMRCCCYHRLRPVFFPRAWPCTL